MFVQEAMHLQCLPIENFLRVRVTLTTFYRTLRVLLFGCLLSLCGYTNACTSNWATILDYVVLSGPFFFSA